MCLRLIPRYCLHDPPLLSPPSPSPPRPCCLAPRACLKLIPHQLFTFAKIWLLAAKLEIRARRLDAARRILGTAIGMAPKNKLFKSYIGEPWGQLGTGVVCGGEGLTGRGMGNGWEGERGGEQGGEAGGGRGRGPAGRERRHRGRGEERGGQRRRVRGGGVAAGGR